MSVEIVGEEQSNDRKYQLVILALIGVLVATWVAVIFLVQAKNSAADDLAETKAANEAGPDAQEAAGEILTQMISYSYRDIADEYDWTRYLADDELRADYEDRIVPTLAKVIKRTKAAAEGEIVQSAYNAENDDEVTVLAFIRQTLTNADNKEGVTDEQWASLTMIRDGDDWLIDKIDIVSVPPPS